MKLFSKDGSVLLAACAASLVGLSERAAAHHSFSMYDQTIEKTLTGKLRRFMPMANHAQLIFELVNPDGTRVMENGEPVVWGVETGPADSLARAGVSVNTFPVGTIMTVTLNPAKDGRKFGALRPGTAGLISCGVTMPDGGCTAETGTVHLGTSTAGTAEARR